VRIMEKSPSQSTDIPRKIQPSQKARLFAAAGLTLVGAGAADRLNNTEPVEPLAEKPSHTELISSQDLHSQQPPAEPNHAAKAEQNPVVQSPEPASWWPVAVKQNWLDIQQSASNYGLDPYLVATIVAEESGGQNIDNTSGATGLMQIMPSTAKEIARLRKRSYYNMHNRQENLDYGCWLIDYVNKKFIETRGVDLNSEAGIAMLAVGYGDGVGALTKWIDSGQTSASLSAQATAVTALWTDMYASRNAESSPVFTHKRGG
jgi:soluble lytic murein transglycosylase-like protein